MEQENVVAIQGGGGVQERILAVEVPVVGHSPSTWIKEGEC